MKITLFGATGGTGQHVLEQACDAGHEVTAVVRNPAGITRTHPNLTVVPADVMDPASISELVTGRDAVISAIGPREARTPTTVQTDATASIIRAMTEVNVRRLIVISNSGMHTDGDGPLTKMIAKPIVRRILKHPWTDMLNMEKLVEASALDWSIIRPPQLTTGPRTGAYRTATNRNVRGGIRVSRADLADCVLRCLADQDSVRAAISIGN